MRCPYCRSEKLQVIDSRETEDAVRRRRSCTDCKKRFTTYEKHDAKQLVVMKRDGRREQFDREKLLRSITIACGKRPISQEKIEQTVDEIEAELRNNDSTEVKSKVIGDMVMEKLKSLDEVAYIRFASVYKKFRDIESFERELKELKRG